MYHGVYILWALLPFTLFCLAMWAVMKKWFKIAGREDPKQYFNQAVYSLMCMIAAILFDQYCLEEIVNAVTMGMLDVDMVRFLLYPFVLLIGAALPVGKSVRTPPPSKFVFSS